MSMNKSLIVRYSIIVLLLSLIFLDQAMAQYRLRFRVYENGPMCGCYSREGVIVRLDANFNRVYYYTAELLPNSQSVYQYDLNLDYDPRDYKWNFEHIPNTNAGCTVFTFSGCSFVGTSNIPIYSGPNSCGVTDVDIVPTTNYIRGLFIAVEFAGPQSPPTLPGGIALDNICSEFVIIETPEKVTTETYTWEVSRSSSGPWKLLTTTTGNDVNKTTISAALLNQKVADGLTDGNFYIRVGTNGTSCGPWAQRYSIPAKVVFQPPVPPVKTAYAISPTCIGGQDGAVVVAELKNADGSVFTPTGELFSYNLTTSTSGNVYKIQSTTLPVTFNNTFSGNNAAIGAGDWFIQVEGSGNFCANTTKYPLLVSDPAAMILQSAAVSQPILCTGGKGAIKATVANGKAPYTYSITGNGHVVSGLLSNTFTNLSSGNYIVSITDACGQVINSGTINLPEPTIVVGIQSLTAQNISCAGQSNGKLMVTASGGTPSYAVQIDGGIFVNILGTSYTASPLAAGNHQVIVRDANGCLASRDITINTNAEVKGKVLANDLKPATCAGISNGVVVVTASGSAGVNFEYSLNGSPYQAVNTFADLAAGSYAVSIRDKDATSCRWDSAVVITEPLPIHIDEFTVTSPISCYEGSNGIIRASASGGTPQFGYTYNLLELTSGTNDSHASANAVLFNNLSAGKYRLTVSDGIANCFVTQDLLLSQPTAVFLNPVLSNYNGQHVSCTASSDGSISIQSTGGIYPHRISVSGRADQLINSSAETAVFNNFQAGDYFFTISDNNGACQKDTLIRLLAPAPLDLNLTAQQFGDGYNVSCHGASNGVLTATAAGGTIPYSYSISPSGNPLNYINTNASAVSFSDLKEGNYTVTITDVNHCQLVKQQLLTEPAELVVAHIIKDDISGYQLKCHGDQNAAVTIFSQGGSYPQTMTLLSSVQQGISNSTAEGVVFNHLAAGNYNFQILDEEGCSVNGNFTLLEPHAVALDQTQTVIEKPDCAGQQTGNLHLQAVGGIGTLYNYQITYLGDRSRLPFPYPEQQTKVGNPVYFDALIAGSYAVLVEDEVGCLHTEPLLIATNNQVTAHLTTTDITCKSDNDGSAALTIAGGLQPYQIIWQHQDDTLQTDQEINENQSVLIQQLKEGLYKFEVSDVNGCAYYSGNYNFQIEGPAQALTLEASVKQITCNGTNNGTLILQAEGGWQEASYLYGNAITPLGLNQTIYENLSPGIYRYFVKDNKGCVDTLDVSIHEPAVLSASISAVKNVSCYGLADANFELNINGGTLPYALSIDNGTTWKADAKSDTLSAGIYTVNVRDSNACTTTLPVTISEPPILKALLVNQQNTLCKQSTGAATVDVTGGSVPYVFSWENYNDHTIGNQLHINGFPAGEYVFHVKDDHSCVTQLPVTIINTNDIVFDVINIQGVKCFGETNGSAEVSIATIQAPYTIAWDNGTTTPSVSTLAAGLRSVVLEDANQCQVSRSFVVPAPDALALSSVQKNSPTCYGLCNGQLVASPSGGTGSYQYSWQNNSSISNTLTNACAGDYQLSVRDANNCLLQEVITLTGPALHKMGIEDTTYYICQGQTVNISLPLWTQHHWSSTNGYNSLTTAVTLNQAGSYSVEATDLSGCSGRADFNVIYSSDLLKAEFLVPKDAFIGDTVVCVNISIPPPDLLLWDFDHNHAISLSQIGSYNELVFLNEGSYTITLTSHLGGCQSQQAKTITIHSKQAIDDNDADLGYHEKGIKELIVFPNPNEGQFRCNVSLYEIGDIHLRVLDLYGKVLAEQQAYEIDQLDADFSIEAYPSGLYWLIVETNDDTQTFKVLVR